MRLDSLDQSPASLGQPVAQSTTAETGFGSRLMDALLEADAVQKEAGTKAQEVAAGKGDLVDTMVTLAKADLAIRFVVNVRNRAVDAYKEIMRIPL